MNQIKQLLYLSSTIRVFVQQKITLVEILGGTFHTQGMDKLYPEIKDSVAL